MSLKRLCLALFFLMSAATHIWAGQLKALIIIQDDARHHPVSLYKDCVYADLSGVLKWLDDIDKYSILPVDIRIIRGSRATYRTIENELRWGQLRQDDVWMVYWTGTGGTTNGDPYLHTADGRVMLLSDLKEIIAKRDARLKLVFTDPKTHLSPFLSTSGFLSEQGSTPVLSTRLLQYQTLLMEHRGTVFINSHSEGEWSWGGPDGSLFSQILFQESLLSRTAFEWDTLFDQIREWSFYRFARIRYGAFLEPGTLKSLKQKGLTGQHARLYTMAAYISNYNSLMLTNSSAKAEQFELILKNPQDQPMTLYWDTQKVNYQDLWSENGLETVTISPRGEKVLKQIFPWFTLYTRPGSGSVKRLLSGTYYTAEDFTLRTRFYSKPAGNLYHPLLGTWRVKHIDHSALKDYQYRYLRFFAQDQFQMLDKTGKLLYTGHWFINYSARGEVQITLKYKEKYRKKNYYFRVNQHRDDQVTLYELKKKDDTFTEENGIILMYRSSQAIEDDIKHHVSDLSLIKHIVLQRTENLPAKGFREYFKDRILTGFQLSFNSSHLTGIQGLYRKVTQDHRPGTYSHGRFFGYHSTHHSLAEYPGYRLSKMEIQSDRQTGHITALRMHWKKWDTAAVGPDQIKQSYGDAAKTGWKTLNLEKGESIGYQAYPGTGISGLGILMTDIENIYPADS